MVACPSGGREVAGSNPVAPTIIMKKKFRIFYSTCGNSKDAKAIANYLLKNNKALCVNLIRNIDSFYLENKKIQNQKEVVLIIKTCCTSIQIQRSLKKIHRYDTPIIVELKTGLPNKDYLKWFFEN